MQLLVKKFSFFKLLICSFKFVNLIWEYADKANLNLQIRI